MENTRPTAMSISEYSLSEVSFHCSTNSLWVVMNGNVYDITSFLFDHPGGEELLLQYGGQDVTEIMKDKFEHLHSDTAYELLEQYLIGTLSTKNSYPSSTETQKDEKNSINLINNRAIYTSKSDNKEEPFIDHTKPMLIQVWNKKFSKETYLKYVHTPRHHQNGSAPLFANPFLEMFTKTAWYVIPIFYAPIIMYNIYIAYTVGGFSNSQLALLFTIGVFLWTTIEYGLHRFLFHLDEYVPDHRVAITLHFITHGVHHFLPMDRLRLVMPPLLGCILSFPIWKLYVVLMGPAMGAGCIAGSYFGFVAYDCMHYYLHHGRPMTFHLREMKSYHLDHHYKNPHLGFGITSKLWDVVLGTTL